MILRQLKMKEGKKGSSMACFAHPFTRQKLESLNRALHMTYQLINSSMNLWNTPGPHLMRIHLVRYSTSARYEKYSIIHLVRPIIHLVRIFALSTS